MRILALLMCIGSGQLFAQSINNHIVPLDRDDQSVNAIRRINGQSVTQLYRTGNFTLELTSLGRPSVTKTEVETDRRYPGELLQVNGESIINSARDSRKLPLSRNGRLLTPEGLEVEFVLPHNPNNPGICATPTPYVIQDNNRKAMANCPITVPCDQAANRDANIPTSTQPIKYMQLNWVVLQTTSGGASSNIDQTRIDQLMNEVNADFAAQRIEFCADPATFVTDDALYTLNAGTEDGTLKTTYGSQPQNWINIYVVGGITNPNAGGYARFPYDPFGGLNIRGGVVLARGNMFLGTHTLAHELGHTFGLFHTFHGVDEVTPCTNCYEGRDLASGASSGGDTEGDWCFDTNPHPTNANICGDQGTDGCAPNLPWLNSPVDNHMSYSFCTSRFTPQQSGRMHCMIDTYLQNWVNFGNATCGSQPPVAEFDGTPTIWQSPHTVNFTDQSVPASLITNWSWNFDVAGIGGVTPATFNGQTPPPVVYTTCDTTYTVSLTVTGPNGSDTETKVNYITVLCPAGNCDTLNTQWLTPTPTPSAFFLGPNDELTGIPAPTLSGGVVAPIGFYERYLTPQPGVSTVGAAELLLTGYNDSDSNTVLQVVIYNSDANGNPVGGPLGGAGGINPGSDLAVSATFLDTFWIPFNKVVIDSPSFLVGMEVFPGDANDALLLISSDNTQGQNAGLNFVSCNGFGYQNYLTLTGLDFDLHLIPMMGSWQAEPVVTFVGELPGCDTTRVLLLDTTLFNECLVSMEFTSANLGVTLTDTTHETFDTLLLTYTTAPPDTISFETINDCGRTNFDLYTLNYTFDTTPNPDFTVNTATPVCAGTPVSFTASPGGGADYTWDFGDGTVASSGTNMSTSHTYTAPGTYYVNLTLTDPSGCAADELKLDIIEVIDCSVNAPIAGFDANPDSVCIADTVRFTDQSLAAPDPATSWLWSFDDGDFSILQNPEHVYQTAGTFNVQLIAENSGGADTTFRQVVVVDPCILAADFILKAVPVGEEVVLSWDAAVGSAEYRYSVQRSGDGSRFREIGLVDQSGKAAFDFVDRGAAGQALWFYRILAKAADGSTALSNVEQVRLDGGANWLNVYPNPVGSTALLHVELFRQENTTMKLGLYDALGREVLSQTLEVPVGRSQLDLKTDQLVPGAYFLRVSAPDGNAVRKVLID